MLSNTEYKNIGASFCSNLICFLNFTQGKTLPPMEMQIVSR